MADRFVWSDVSVKKAKKILAQHESMATALGEISKALNRNVTADSLDGAFKRHGAPRPFSFLKPPPLHPVEAAQKRADESRLKTEHKKLVEDLREANARQAFIEAAAANRQPPRIMPREKTSGLREMTPIVLASDWHVEEPVEPEAVAYVNEYNLEIAEQRIRRFYEGIIWQVEHHRASGQIAVRDMVLWKGGDLMTGYIHPELVESNELSPTETMLWLMPQIRDGIYSLLERLELDRLVIPWSYGNHGRTTDKPRIATGYANSYEWLMGHQLAAEFRKDKRVEFVITASPHQYVQVYDFWLHFHHGDDVKYAGGVGGITIPLKKRIPMWDLVKRCDYHHVGHFHQYLDHERFTVNGSLIGYGPFSQRIGAEIEPPQQAFYMLDSRRGKCMKTPLWVGEEPQRRAA